MKIKDMKNKIDGTTLTIDGTDDTFKDSFVSLYSCSFPENDEITGNVKITTNKYGWICPRCEKVYSPDVKECWRCNNKDEETATSTTEIKYSKYNNMY